MVDKHLQFVEQAQAQRPEIAAELAELGELYQRKLWHQLTLKLEELIEQEPFLRGGFIIALYQNFITGFAHKINLLKLAFFAVAVSKQMQDPQVRARERAGTRSRLSTPARERPAARHTVGPLPPPPPAPTVTSSVPPESCETWTHPSM